ncbi:NAD(P)/FAD-dependent oxidoreductase [Phragmitibacter flavus]|uniref:Pyridine nucleotide-disulfide oxidoreductase domain-containing protein 2 n=1 Tax=Phragmitibacter flavus TaxID=2576071 RepID=A0A5R8KEN8_9BACT|nr:NAD(P)/FAD-dependent oxidoreductase [Phragmitibacter flavus]TLD70721.1 NAD(P)/FAD-dependent oxidoreductase [Phragmitibacter flavus]
MPTAIIIGSGPNGLTAAIRLAQAGWETTVLEGSDTPGGGTRTKDLTLPGFHHDVCSAVHPMGVASPYLRSLDLESHGLKWLHPEIPLAHPITPGHAVVLYQSLSQTAAALGKDAPRYRRLFEPLVKNALDLYSDLLRPAAIPTNPLAAARFGIPAALPATLLAKYFSTPEARALFAGNAAHSVIALENPFTSAIGLMLQMSAHVGGWPIPKGGSQSITKALIKILKSLNGKIQLNTPVTKFTDLPDADAYLFDISPKNLAKICADSLPKRYLGKLNRYRHGPGVFKIDYALNAPIPWRNEACRKAGTVHVGGTIDEVAASERAAWEGKPSEHPFLLVAQPTITDPGRAPKDQHIAWTYCHVPNGCTRDMRPAIEAQIERFAPGFRDTILDAHVLNTEHMEHYNPNYIGGDVVGGVTDWRQLLTRPVSLIDPYATPNPKIFLCSASTPPGGGVHGMCGYWAAECVIKKNSNVAA